MAVAVLQWCGDNIHVWRLINICMVNKSRLIVFGTFIWIDKPVTRATIRPLKMVPQFSRRTHPKFECCLRLSQSTVLDLTVT